MQIEKNNVYETQQSETKSQARCFRREGGRRAKALSQLCFRSNLINVFPTNR